MKYIILPLVAILVSYMVALADENNMLPNTTEVNTQLSEMKDLVFTVNGVSFVMKPVEGGAFIMGATSEQGRDANDDEKPTHRVVLNDFYMGETEVTQSLWEAVMGSNPSADKGDNLPVESVSWSDCQKFIKKLNLLTGKNFSLPTEAEWEYAARGGNRSGGNKYSGSKFISIVAWYDENSGSATPAVKQMQANELGLYDMSGNVAEWCMDWYGDYSGVAQTNPTGPSIGTDRVMRGGSRLNLDAGCRVSARYACNPERRLNFYGLRLRLAFAEENSTQQNTDDIAVETTAHSSAMKDLTFKVKDVSFVMKPVKGGTFMMGATSEQESDAWDEEKPAHRVTLSDFYLGETEVTQGLWKAVMGTNPPFYTDDDLPVGGVNWNDCQKFIKKLNLLTGKKFSLPTEAEWEYAARGGNHSKGYKYSGSNSIDDVAWCSRNSGGEIHVGKQMQGNELGLYDMSGNVAEWCKDWYNHDNNYYSNSPQVNPAGPAKTPYKVVRGGSWSSIERSCRVSSRSCSEPIFGMEIYGLRLRLGKL